MNQNANECATNFELRLMIGAKRAFLSVTPPNEYHTYSFDKYVCFVPHRAFFHGTTENTCDYLLWPTHPVQVQFFWSVISVDIYANITTNIPTK